jgi:hypothetical protein
LAVVNKRVVVAPGLLGCTGIVAYLSKEKTAVVVFTTSGPDAPPGTHYAGAIFNRVGQSSLSRRVRGSRQIGRTTPSAERTSWPLAGTPNGWRPRR